MKTAFLLAHFKWHKKLKLKTSDEYPVTVTKKHYYHVTDEFPISICTVKLMLLLTVKAEDFILEKQRKRTFSDVNDGTDPRGSQNRYSPVSQGTVPPSHAEKMEINGVYNPSTNQGGFYYEQLPIMETRQE